MGLRRAVGRAARRMGFDPSGPSAVRLRELVDETTWRARGRPVPPPPAVKRRIIRAHARRHHLEVLVETGTYLGDTVAAFANDFTRIVSIELSEALHAGAAERFRDRPNIEILQGDSASRLRDVLAGLDVPALFWLDAHWSAGVTARGRLDTPISEELDAILEHAVDGHVVLIDDARDFVGANDYPTIEGLRHSVAERAPERSFVVADDIIRILPGR